MPQDDQQELFYHVDENNQVIGSVTRGEAHTNPDIIHRSVYLFITNSNNQLLIQQRSFTKDKGPGQWAESVGEHVTYGETYEVAAVRGAREELGLDLQPTYRDQGLFILPSQKEYSYIYQATHESNLTNLDTNEIEQVQWVAFDKLTDFIKIYDCSPGFLQALDRVNLY